MGWNDSNDQFQPDPTKRLLRALPSIFDKDKKLEADTFMERLAEKCPELDGGKLFLQANQYSGYNSNDKRCSLGLSQALLSLHEDEIITLYCPGDSRGWDIGIAEPSFDETILEYRISKINLGKTT